MLTNNMEVHVSASDEKVELVHHAFQRSSSKSIRQASKEVQVPSTTLYRVLCNRLQLFGYNVQIVQELKPDDMLHRRNFTTDISIWVLASFQWGYGLHVRRTQSAKRMHIGFEKS